MKHSSPLRLNVKAAIAPTIVAVVIMIVTLKLFGLENSMIAPFATLSYMRFLQMRCHYPCMLKHYLIYCIVIAAAHAANLCLPVCILVDFAVFFVLAYIVIDEYDPTNYFPFGMAMIFFQYAPLPDVPAMLTRILALTVSFGIILVFVLITAPVKYGKDPIREYIEEGFSLCENLVAACRRADRNAVVEGHLKVREINKKCSDEIYAYNRTTFTRTGMVNFYCRFIVLFQVINDLTHSEDPAVPPKESKLLKAEALLSRFRQELEERKPEQRYWNFRFRSGRIDVWDFRFRFAMRQVLVMVPCMAFATAGGLPNVSWLPFSLFFMLIPSTDDTPQVVRRRFFGSLFGIAGCLVLFAFFPSLTARIIMTAIFSFLIYSAESYTASVAYVTCATLAMQTLNMPPFVAMGQCLAYTAAGAVIALLANRYLFSIHTDIQIERLLAKLAGIRARLIELRIPDTELQKQAAEVFGVAGTEVLRTPLSRYARTHLSEEEQKKHETDQLTIHSYLIARRIEALDQSRPEARRDPETLLGLEKEHMRFMAELL